MAGLSKVKCINGYDNDFVTLFLDDGRDLFNGVVFALPFAIEQKIIPAHVTSACRRLPGPLPNSLFHFRAARSSLQRLFLRVFGKANAFHDPDRRLQLQPYRFFTSSWLSVVCQRLLRALPRQP